MYSTEYIIHMYIHNDRMYNVNTVCKLNDNMQNVFFSFLKKEGSTRRYLGY